ncbi:MAG: N-acetylglucosamine-6-phosphate deacetylase [Pseudomonadota bacterium]
MATTAFIGARLILPDREVLDHALLVEGSTITAIVPLSDVPTNADRLDLGGLVLAPGFIDVQVNGGGGVLFNDDPSADTIDKIGRAHLPYGTTSFLPTLISDTEEKMAAALSAADDARTRSIGGAIGLHLEGPFLNADKRGIHDAAHFRALSDETVATLAAFDAGHLMLTVAPEQVSAATVRQLTEAGVLVSAGHTAATYEQTISTLNAGLRGFTHLYNAMPPMLSRAPGPVAAALESDAWCSIIADGHHVSDTMLKLAIRAKSDGRIMLITDAMSSIGTNRELFKLGDKRIFVRDGHCVDENGTLAGAHLTMIGAVENAVMCLGQSLVSAVRMASLEPARFLKCEHLRGSLSPGRRADLVAWDDTFSVIVSAKADELSSFHENFSQPA